MSGARRGQELRRRLGLAMSELQHEGQVVAGVRLLRAAGQDLPVGLDRSVEVGERVAHEPEAVERLDLTGLAAQDLLELGARG